MSHPPATHPALPTLLAGAQALCAPAPAAEAIARLFGPPGAARDLLGQALLVAPSNPAFREALVYPKSGGAIDYVRLELAATPALQLSALEGAFGAGRSLPRVSYTSPEQVMFSYQAQGFICRIFAELTREDMPDRAVAGIMLRYDGPV